MNLFASPLFFLLAVIEAIAIFYLVLLGMAPGVKPLESTRPHTRPLLAVLSSVAQEFLLLLVIVLHGHSGHSAK
jgi:hypothetical protein